jgi:hypothetical protein
VLEVVFVLLEYPSPSRRIFIGSHSLLPSLVRRIGPSTSLTYLSLEYGDNMSQEGASKGRFKFPLIKTSGTYLNTTSSLLGDEQTSKHGRGGRYYAN